MKRQSLKHRTDDPTQGLESIEHLAKHPTRFFHVELESPVHLRRVPFEAYKPTFVDDTVAVLADTVAANVFAETAPVARYWPRGFKWAARLLDRVRPIVKPTWKSVPEVTTLTIYRELRPGCNRAVLTRKASEKGWRRVEA